MAFGRTLPSRETLHVSHYVELDVVQVGLAGGGNCRFPHRSVTFVSLFNFAPCCRYLPCMSLSWQTAGEEVVEEVPEACYPVARLSIALSARSFHMIVGALPEFMKLSTC